MAATTQVSVALDTLKKTYHTMKNLPIDSVSILLLIRDTWLTKTNNGNYRTVLRVKDPCRLYGGEFCSRSMRTRVGIVLRWLVNEDYLIEIRPGKYKPTHKFLEWIMICKWPHCESNGSLCGLIDVCPVHKLQQIIERKEVE